MGIRGPENGKTNGHTNGAKNGHALAFRAHIAHLDTQVVKLMHAAGTYSDTVDSGIAAGTTELPSSQTPTMGFLSLDNALETEPEGVVTEKPEMTGNGLLLPTVRPHVKGTKEAALVETSNQTRKPELQTRESGSPVIELSMYEPGHRSFVGLVDRMFGLTESGLLTQDQLFELINPEAPEDQLLEAERKPGSEVILYRKAERERLAKEYPALVLEDNFYKFIGDVYGITDSHAAERFYEGIMNLTNEVFDGMRREILPYSKGRLGLRNEIDPPQHHPARLFYQLISPNTHPVLRFETQRALTTLPLAGEFVAQMWNYRLRGKLNNIMEVLDEQMFEGMTGEAHSMPVNVWHDATTGRVNRIDEPGSSKKPVPNANYKEHGILMRRILDMDEKVWIDLDEKNLATAIMKSIIKAGDPEEAKKKNRPLGVIAPLDDATDLARLVIAVNGGNDEVMKVMGRFREIIEDPENYEFLSDVEEVKEDHSTSKRRGQSSHIKFKRLQIQFEDLPIPVEVQFYDMRRFLNSQLAIGKKRKDGMYDGGAHELYQRYRLMKAFRTVFPESIYPDPEDKPYEVMAMEHTDQLAADLLERVLEAKAA